MNTDQSIIEGISLKKLRSQNKSNNEVVRMALSRSILSRLAAKKGIELYLVRTKGTYIDNNKIVVPVESVQTEVVTPVFDTPQVEAVPVMEIAQAVEEIPVMEMPKVEEVTSISEISSTLNESVPIMEMPQAVEEIPVVEDTRPHYLLDDINQQRVVQTTSPIKEIFKMAEKIIDTPIIPNEGNLVTGEIGVPQLEPIPTYVENVLPTESEIQPVANMDLPVVDQEPVEEEKYDEVPVVEQESVDSKEVFTPIEKTSEDEVNMVISGLEQIRIESIKLREMNETLASDLEREKGNVRSLESQNAQKEIETQELKTSNETLASDLELEKGNVRSLESQNAQKEIETQELKTSNETLTSDLELEKGNVRSLESQNAQKEIETQRELDSLKSEVSNIVDKATENEKIANEFKYKYRLLFDKVNAFVKEPEMVETSSEHKMAA